MKNLFLLIHLFILIGCQSSQIVHQQEQKALYPAQKIIKNKQAADALKISQWQLPQLNKSIPSRTPKQIERLVGQLQSKLGHWPVRVRVDQKDETFLLWSSLVEDAAAYLAQTLNKAHAYYLLAELYRQGNNFDVPGSANKALETLELCFMRYSQAVGCHFSAIYLYLSTDKKFLPNAANSLEFLKAFHAPKAHPEVEYHLAILYIHQGKKEQALSQLKRYIEAFPYHGRIPEANNLYQGIQNNRIRVITG